MASDDIPGHAPEQRAQPGPELEHDYVVVDPVACFSLSLRQALVKASGDAHVRREAYAVEHLFCALLDERHVRKALDELGLDRRRLVMRTFALLDDTSAEHRSLVEAGIEESGVSALLSRCVTHAIASESLPIHGGHVLVEMIKARETGSRVAQLLIEHGVTELQLKRYVAHGSLADFKRAVLQSRSPGSLGPRRPDSAVEHGPRNEFHAIPTIEVEVIAHNDPYTTKEFVVQILQDELGKSSDEATEIMLQAHNRGVGVVTVLTPEVAAQKIATVHEEAGRQGYPLRLSVREYRPDRGKSLWFRLTRWLARERR